jgi:hypothetical protein
MCAVQQGQYCAVSADYWSLGKCPDYCFASGRAIRLVFSSFALIENQRYQCSDGMTLTATTPIL